MKLSNRNRSLLLAGTLSIAAIAQSVVASAVQAQTTLDNTFVTRLRNVQLTSADFQVLVCGAGGYSFLGSIPGLDSSTRVCNILAQVDPNGFFSTTTPVYYKLMTCEPAPPGGQRPYIVVGNLLATTGDFGSANYSGALFPLSTPTSMTLDACFGNSYNWVNPSWFTPASASQPTIAFVNMARRASTVPRSSINASYAQEAMAFGAVRVGDYSALNVPFTTGGTAIRETNYFLRNRPPNDTAPVQTFQFGVGNSIDSFYAYVPYESTNHPERTITAMFSAPPGYNVVTPTTVMGRILELNLSSVGIAPINGNATLTPGATSGNGFTLTRAGGDTTQPLAVNYTIAGTAANGTDYGYLNGTVTMPANATSLNIPVVVPVPTGSTATIAKTIALTVTPVDGAYNAATTPGNTTTLTIPAYNPATVAIAPVGGTTLNPGSSGSFTVTRTGGDTTQPLTVNLATSGNAVAGTDYENLPSTITIPAGQTTATVPVTARPRTGTATTAKDLSVAIASGQGYTTGSGTNSVNYTIGAYSPNVVTVAVSGNGNLTPGTSQPAITATRSGGDTSQPLTIPLVVGGTATPGTDYNPLPSSITIPAGATTATLSVAALPQSGTTARPASTITVAAAPPGASDTYTVSGTGATLNIPAYNPPAGQPAITVSAPNGTTLPAGSTTPALQFTRTGATTGNLPVYYTIGGTATSGSDYSGLSGQTVIPSGQSSVTVPVTIPAGATVGRTIAVNLAIPGSLYGSGTNTQANYTIGAASNAVSPTTVTVAFDPSIPALIVTRSGGSTTQPLSVPLTIGGDALPGIDYASIPNSANFAGGQTTLTIPLQLLPGATNGRTVTVSTPNSSASYTISGLPVAVAPAPTPTPTPSTNRTGGNDGGGGSALAPIAGVAGLGGILAASGVFSSGGVAAASTGFAAVPAYCAQANGDIQWDILPGTNGGIIFAKPDVTFSRLGLAHTKGQVKVKGQVVAWGGQSNPATPADALNLGNLEGVYNLQCLNLAQIEKASGKKLSDKPLGETGLMRNTALVNLSKTAYKNAKTVGDIPGMAEMLAKKLPQGSTLTKEAIAKLSFAELFQQVPQLQQLNLGSLAVGQIPGFMQVPLANMSDWKQFAISEVPGLVDVPFSQFPSKPATKSDSKTPQTLQQSQR